MISRIFVVLANPWDPQDQRSQVVTDLCKTFVSQCKTTGATVDLLDLYQESFNPVKMPNEKDTNISEYQIRIKKADLIVFFHPIWWDGLPAILKGFIDKVFTQGFAYKVEKKINKGLLTSKELWAVAVSEKPAAQIRLLYGDSVRIFWQRSVAKFCGMQSKFFHFDQLRSVDNQTIQNWHTKLTKIADKINKNGSVLDLM